EAGFASGNRAAEQALSVSDAAKEAAFASSNRSEEAAFATQNHQAELAESRLHRAQEGNLQQFNSILVQFANMIDSMREEQKKRMEAESEEEKRKAAERSAQLNQMIEQMERLASNSGDKNMTNLVVGLKAAEEKFASSGTTDQDRIKTRIDQLVANFAS